MLSVTDNQLLTRVGPGTPTGELLRQYWLPVLFDGELTPDGAPERVRLLGEDLIAWRNTDGTIGLMQNACPHRGASMFFGRNEENGLRCVYHGWKFDAEGMCTDMPNEPAESNFKHKIRAVAYATAERGGVIWVYMGTQRPLPPLPGLEWMDLPASQVIASKRVAPTNWLQGLEGEIDQSHVSFVHSRLHVEQEDGRNRNMVDRIRALDRSPHFEVVATDYGVCIGAGRDAPDNQKYWRITQFLMPSHNMTGPYGANPVRNWRCWVPIDDENVFVIGCSFHPTRAFTPEERQRMENNAGVWTISTEMRAPATSQPFGRWYGLPAMDNDFFVDREMQRTKTYSGIAEFWAQDSAMQVTMGPIYDRTKEHLGTTDLAIIAVRRRVAAAARALRDKGEIPAEVGAPPWYQIRSDAVLLPTGQPWFEATMERRKATVGANPDCV